MSNKYELEIQVRGELCYEHNKDSKCPYYVEGTGYRGVDKSDRGAIDIELDKATKRSFTFKLWFRNVSEDYAIDWCEQYFARFNMRMRDSADTQESEKGFYYVKASVPTEDICKYYGMEYE